MAESFQPTRRELLAGSMAGVTAVLAGAALPSPALATLLPGPWSGEGPRSCCPRRIAVPRWLPQVAPSDLAAGNALARTVAQRSALVTRAHGALLALAEAVPDPLARAATRGVLANPAPTYQLRSPSAADRIAVRQELLAAGLIPEATTVDGIFPPVPDPGEAPQPVWVAPGSSFGAHHAYPGGLVVHEWFNATMAVRFAATYDEVYGLQSTAPADAGSLLYGPTLWHDIQKVSVFQWLPDGSELAEQIIADTGAHHALGGAEALVRGLPAAWVVAQLSAHDAPTNVEVRPNETGRYRLVNYLRAAAIVARMDPVAIGLLRATDDGGYALAQEPPWTVSYINHFADHDWLLTNDALAATVAALRALAVDYGIDPDGTPARFNLFRNLVLSQLSEVRLYAALAASGPAGVRALVDQAVDLTALRG